MIIEEFNIDIKIMNSTSHNLEPKRITNSNVTIIHSTIYHLEPKQIVISNAIIILQTTWGFRSTDVMEKMPLNNSKQYTEDLTIILVILLR